jgi:hypothetical protein
MARSDLPARLRAQARGPLWDDKLAQVRALLREAAQRIDELEANEAPIERPTSWHLSECGISQGLSNTCTCHDDWPD